MSEYLILGADLGDLAIEVNKAITNDGHQPVGEMQYTNGKPAQAMSDEAGDITTYYTAVGNNIPTLIAEVNAQIALGLQPTGLIQRYNNLLVAIMVDNGGGITEYDMVATPTLGDLYPLLADIASEDKFIFGETFRYGNLYVAQVVVGTPFSGGGGGPGEDTLVYGNPVISLSDGSEFQGTAQSFYCVMQYYSDVYGTVAFQIVPMNETTISFDPEGPLTIGDPVPDDPYGAIFLDNNLLLSNDPPDEETEVEVTVTFTFTFTGQTIVQKRRTTVIPQ